MAKKPAPSRSRTVAPPAAPPAPPAPAQTLVTGPAVDLALLQAINLATLNNSFAWVTPPEYQPMQAAGLVIVNEQFSNPENPAQRATQTTDTGRLYIAEHTGQTIGAQAPGAAAGPGNLPAALVQAQTGAAALSIADKFKLGAKNEAPGELPAPRRGGAAKEAPPTPLDDLEINKAYDWQVCAAMPNPAKELAPLVSATNRKYTRGTGTFEAKTFMDTLVDGAGNVITDEQGKPRTQARVEQVEVKEHVRRFEMRSLHNADGTLWGARIQRVK